jgi:predicted phosphodiesterase
VSEPPATARGSEQARPDPERTDVLELPTEVQRVVVLGDPHGDLIALEQVLLQESRPDTLILSAGDNVGYSDALVSSYLCQVLEERKIRSVRGNHEAWSEDGSLFHSPPGLPRQLSEVALRWINSLPTRIRLRAGARPGLRISLTHSLPDWAYVNAKSARRFLDLEEADLVLCGHTHRPAIYSVGPRARQATTKRFDPRSKTPLRIELKPTTRYVCDAGSLARPSRPRRGKQPGGMCLEYGTYAVVDLQAGVLELRSVDKRARLQEVFEQLAGG